MLLSLGKQNTISNYTAQALSHRLRLLKVIDLSDQQLTECFGAGENHSFQIADNIVSNEAFLWHIRRPFLHALVRSLKKDGIGIASQPGSALELLAKSIIDRSGFRYVPVASGCV